MRRLAVVTSGGDAPGMNAAVRAITRVGAEADIEVYGVRDGYKGLIEGDMIHLTERGVSGILQLGGTILGTVRSEEFKTAEAQHRAIENLKKNFIDGLVVIGGDGSQKGAFALFKHGFPVVGVASTIDNDLYGSDITIGVDTALNTIVESIDKIRTTAESHERAFLIEVMGRKYGYLALMAGLAGGAELVVTPEFEVDPATVADELLSAYERGKRYAMVVVTDGAKNNAETIAKYFKEHGEKVGYELRVTILGHVQRGGAPSAFDRILASRLGAAAVQLFKDGGSGMLTGWINGKVAYTPLEEVVTNKKALDINLWRLAEILSR
ncbi:MAG: 6-phosphofructokinase [Actinomycetota bacterium]|nr:6-phosphofructokinase [Actinomycetota bacterium]